MTSRQPWVLGLWSKGPSGVYAAGIEFLSIISSVAAINVMMILLPTSFLTRFSSGVSSGSFGATTSASFGFAAAFFVFGFDLDAD